MLLSLVFCINSFAEIIDVTIDNPSEWKAYDSKQWSGDTVRFLCPMYVTNNYVANQLSISPQRLYSPTNLCEPSSEAMILMQSHNASAQVALTGISDYHRVAERIDGLVAKISNYSVWQFISADRWYGTREDVMLPPSVDGDSTHSLLVCAWNLEYYLVENFGTGFGPYNQEQHDRQRTKISEALNKINADIYAFCEVEQGQSALRELAGMSGSNYTFINDGGTANGSYIKVGYVYDSTKVETVGALQNNNTDYLHRKKMITFREKATGESFILSINHFKAKSGNGSGADADQGDGQGVFNATRTAEAKSVISAYDKYSKQINEKDILVVGDLNAYAKEDPITTFTNLGYVDLHKAYHADSSYSYVFRGVLGYLDHAIANPSMARQITGMAAWHINSPENDIYHYSNSTTDLTMFRSSDHDPLLIGLRLNNQDTKVQEIAIVNSAVLQSGNQPLLQNAAGGYYRIYSVSGILMGSGAVESDNFMLPRLSAGLYVLDVFANGGRKQFKLIVR